MKLSKRKKSRSAIAVVLAGHGSRALGFDRAMRRIAADLKKDGHYCSVICAFLEIAKPSIPDAVEKAIQRGASQVRVMPFFVHLGRHVQSDIPKILSELRLQHPGVQFLLSPYLGYGDQMTQLVQQRLKEAKQRF